MLIAVHLPLRSFELWVARRTGEVSAVQASALEVRVLEERSPKLGTFKMCLFKLDILKVGFSKANELHIRPSEVRASQNAIAESERVAFLECQLLVAPTKHG